MNLILPTAIIFTAALFHGGQGVSNGGSMTSDLKPSYKSKPCQKTSINNSYENFKRKHILQSDFNRASLPEWERYLEEHQLCGRVPKQSFIEADDEEKVKQICSRSGLRLNKGNLCISESAMVIYHVYSQIDSVINVTIAKHRVIVACNKVGNRCLPVHYEKYNNENPGNVPCVSHA